MWNVVIVITLVALMLVALWFKFPTDQRIPAPLARVLWSVVIVSLAGAVLWSPMQAKYLREYPPKYCVYQSRDMVDGANSKMAHDC